MKKILGISIIIFLLGTLSVNSQDYDCSYTFRDELFFFSLTKKDQDTYLFNQDYDSKEFILGDDSKTLMLGNQFHSKDDGMGIRVIFIDKILNKFSITVLINPIARVDYKNGIWGDMEGSCNKSNTF
jgi:hypothetical protein